MHFLSPTYEHREDDVCWTVVTRAKSPSCDFQSSHPRMPHAPPQMFAPQFHLSQKDFPQVRERRERTTAACYSSHDTIDHLDQSRTLPPGHFFITNHSSLLRSANSSRHAFLLVYDNKNEQSRYKVKEDAIKVNEFASEGDLLTLNSIPCEDLLHPLD